MGFMSNFLFLLLYVVVSAFGLYKIKAAEHVMSVEFAIGFVAYGVGFLLWLYILIRTPLSFAFPIAAGALILSTQLIGYFLLDEDMSILHGIGVSAIVVGIVLITLRV